MDAIFGNGNTEKDLERMMDWAGTRKKILHAVNSWDELVSTFALLVDRADMTYPHFEKDAGAAILEAAKEVLIKIQEVK